MIKPIIHIPKDNGQQQQNVSFFESYLRSLQWQQAQQLQQKQSYSSIYDSLELEDDEEEDDDSSFFFSFPPSNNKGTKSSFILSLYLFINYKNILF